MGLRPAPSCSEALGDLPDADRFATLNRSDEVKTSAWGDASDYGNEMCCSSRASWHFGQIRLWDPTVLTSSAQTSYSEISKTRFTETDPGSVEPISRFFKLSPSGVSNTLRAGTDAARGAFTSPRPIHYEKPRCVTVREMARLHGFPDWFRFHRTKWHGARQIGNAVPPPLASEVTSAIGASPEWHGFKKEIGQREGKESRPSRRQRNPSILPHNNEASAKSSRLEGRRSVKDVAFFRSTAFPESYKIPEVPL